MLAIRAAKTGGGTAFGTHIPFFVGIAGCKPAFIRFWIWHMLIFKVN